MKARIKNNSGSILVLVLWALGLLTVFAVYLGIGLRQRLEFLERMETRNTLAFIAEAGVKKTAAEIGNLDKQRRFVALKDAWSSNPGVFLQAPCGVGTFTVGYGYYEKDFSAAGSGRETVNTMYGAADVDGSLNLNTAEREELARLIQHAAAVGEDTADAIACAIIDWRDEDTVALAHGAEDAYYRSARAAYECKDFFFETLEELCYIKGMTPEIFSSIQPYLTVYGSGKVNINTAPAATLAALGIGENSIAKIINFRCGQDGAEATADDRAFESLSSVVPRLSQEFELSSGEVAQLSNLVAGGKLSVFSDVFLIKSTASLNRRAGMCSVECVFKKDTRENSKRAGEIIGWRMNYLM